MLQMQIYAEQNSVTHLPYYVVAVVVHNTFIINCLRQIDCLGLYFSSYRM